MRLWRRRPVQETVPVPIGTGALIPCGIVAEDYALVQAAESQRLGRVVALAVFEGETRVTQSVVLSPMAARRFAAAILDQADAADGTQPLVFHPPSPDGRGRAS